MVKRGSQKRKRSKIAHHRRAGPGAPPGTLTADPHAPKPVVYAIAFGADGVEEGPILAVEALAPLLDKYPVTWVNVEGLGDVETIRQLGDLFHLHPLALEDVLNVHQRAKSEPYGDHQFVVLRMASSSDRFETEQVSIFFGERFVITFQEGVAGDSFDPVRERLRKAGGPIRRSGPDYLVYALIDAVVDHYFPVLERFGEHIDHLEDQVIISPGPATLDAIHAIKRDLLALRKAFWPLREAVNSLVREPIPLISDETRLYFRDVYDHIIQVIDIVETYRELGSGLMDVYLSSVSNRMNEVMKLLTVMSTIFIPLTFIAGIYGMNFNPQSSRWNMPELNWSLGYPFALLMMAVTAIALLAYFRRRGWLGAGAVTPAEMVANRTHKAEARTTPDGIHPW